MHTTQTPTTSTINSEKFIQEIAELEKARENGTLYRYECNDDMASFEKTSGLWEGFKSLFSPPTDKDDQQLEAKKKFQQLKERYFGIAVNTQQDATAVKFAHFNPLTLIYAMRGLKFLQDEEIVTKKNGGAFNKIFENFENERKSLINKIIPQAPFNDPEKASTTTTTTTPDNEPTLGKRLRNFKQLELIYETMDDKEKEDLNSPVVTAHMLFKDNVRQQTFWAHEEYTNLSNRLFHRMSAEDVLSAKLGRKNYDDIMENAPELGARLLNIVKYGDEASRVIAGKTNPSFFWNIRKIWNKIKWFSFEDRTSSEFSKKETKKLNELKTNNPQRARVIEQLMNDRASEVGIGVVTAYTDYLLELAKSNKGPDFAIANYLDNTETSANNFSNNAKFQLKDFYKETSEKIHFLTFVFEGAHVMYPRHIVVIALNNQTKQIQYYDPQGLPPDHPDRRVYGNFNMADQLKLIREEWEKNDATANVEIVINQTIHQEDIHNCGIYICDFMKRYVFKKEVSPVTTDSGESVVTSGERESFEAICLNGKNNKEITKTRDTIAKELLSMD